MHLLDSVILDKDTWVGQDAYSAKAWPSTWAGGAAFLTLRNIGLACRGLQERLSLTRRVCMLNQGELEEK